MALHRYISYGNGDKEDDFSAWKIFATNDVYVKKLLLAILQPCYGFETAFKHLLILCQLTPLVISFCHVISSKLLTISQPRASRVT